MANYLRFSTEPTECEACGTRMSPGVVRGTDEIQADRRLDAICSSCLESLDAELVAVWFASEHQRTRAVALLAADMLADALKRCEVDGCALQARLLQALAEDD